MVRKTAVLTVAILVLTAGCVGSILGNEGTGGQNSPPPIDHVPSDVSFVASYDADLLQDPTTQSVVDYYLQKTVPNGSDKPQSLEGYVEKLENQTTNETNLSFTAVSGATAFGKIPSMDRMMGGPGTPALYGQGQSAQQTDYYVGVIVKASWSEDDVVSALRKENDVTEKTHEGVTTYLVKQEDGQDLLYANYEGNNHVIGSKAAVQDVIEVSKGKADPLSGELRDAYESTKSDGHLRYAVEIPKDYRKKAANAQSMSMFSAGNITHVSGAYYTEGGQQGTVGMTISLHATSSDMASTIKSQVEGIRAMGKSFVQKNMENSSLATYLDKIKVSASGEKVDITFEASVSEMKKMIDQIPTDGSVLGPSEPGPETPQVSVDFEYDASTGTVTAVHNGGDTVDGDNLEARCGGTTVPVESGQITAGDTIVETSQCDPGDELRIVWTSDEGDMGQTLAEFEIPRTRLTPALAG